jgi:hypothetical protein
MKYFGTIVLFWAIGHAPLAAQNLSRLFSPQGIAEIHITLDNGKQIGDIKNEKANSDYAGKIDARMEIRNSAHSRYEPSAFYTGRIKIDGRGNTSWHHDKRPYNIDLVEEDGATERDAALLGMGESDEWCLLAFWIDRSVMRFQLASWLGAQMEHLPWMPANRYVEVWINGNYRGLYALTEKIKRGKGNIDIKKLDATSTDLSGGYILEATPRDGGKSKPIETQTQIQTGPYDVNFVFKYPKPKNVTEAQRTWIRNYLNEFEEALRSDGFTDPTNGYLKYIDEDSFIDWTILHELSKGCDNLFHASVFVQKDRGSRLQMSAPWDFDLSFGNSGVFSEEGNWVKTHRWWSRLNQDPRYAAKFIARYEALFPLFCEIPAVLDANFKQLDETGVLLREQERFPNILMEYNNQELGYRTPETVAGHVRYLADWATSRNNWIYINLGRTDEEKGLRMRDIQPVIRILEPEVFMDEAPFRVKVMRTEDGNNRYAYSWNGGAYNNNPERRITNKGKYWVHIRDEWGNVSLASDTLYFGVPKPWPTGLATPAATEFSAIYRPQTHTITITAPTGGPLTIRLIDISGRAVRHQVFSQTHGPAVANLAVANLPAGIYILQGHSGTGHWTTKIRLE